ncbi:MAG: hypothetical protein Q9198_008460, partial [Flavoplaca austrocitrina]
RLPNIFNLEIRLIDIEADQETGGAPILVDTLRRRSESLFNAPSSTRKPPLTSPVISSVTWSIESSLTEKRIPSSTGVPALMHPSIDAQEKLGARYSSGRTEG